MNTNSPMTVYSNCRDCKLTIEVVDVESATLKIKCSDKYDAVSVSFFFVLNKGMSNFNNFTKRVVYPHAFKPFWLKVISAYEKEVEKLSNLLLNYIDQSAHTPMTEDEHMEAIQYVAQNNLIFSQVMKIMYSL